MELLTTITISVLLLRAVAMLAMAHHSITSTFEHLDGELRPVQVVLGTHPDAEVHAVDVVLNAVAWGGCRWVSVGIRKSLLIRWGQQMMSRGPK